MSRGKGTILIIDDESESLALLMGVLSGEGYTVRPADSGELALASIETSIPDLILLDMRMPGMDGFDVFRQLKAREQTREIPVMFISGSTDAEDRIRSLALGAVDFVTKPFDRAELLARVGTHLELGRLRSELEALVAERTKELLSTVEQLKREVAERERTADALRESESRFRDLADNAPVMIVTSNEHRDATFFNKVWLDFRGRSLEQERGKGWIDGVHPDDQAQVVAGLAASYTGRNECNLEYRLRRADGEYRIVLCRGIPRHKPQGTFIGYIGSCVDITDLRRGQEEALARQKLESLGVLAGGIAHDFNNILASVMANAHLLEAELPDGSPASDCLSQIEAVAMRGAEIVRQLMVYAGQESTEFELVDFSELVREMLQLLKVSIARNAVLNMDLPRGLPLIRANPAQIRQVVMNLIMNASDALEGKDGFVSISLARARLSAESAGCERQLRDFLQLQISDTGCGMSPETQRAIFDPFFTTKSAGRGLGLAAVQGIVRSHEGYINVTSAPGRGSCFRICLPCSADTENRASLGAAEAPSDIDQPALARTILMVEDTDALRHAIAKMLRRAKFNVIEASDGRIAMEICKEQAAKIDVVLLDVTVPGPSGRELLEGLKKMNPHVRTIVTTAHTREHAATVLGEHNSWSYIRKPYRFGDLLDMIRRTLSGAEHAQAHR